MDIVKCPNWEFKCKNANIGFFTPKPDLKGVDQDFLFDRKFF